MFKIIMTFKRKQGLSRASLIELYESGHVPLARKLVPPLELYRRNYLVNDDPFLAAIGDDRGSRKDYEAPFDVLTEAIYTTRAHAIEALNLRMSSPAGQMLADDEDRFIEPGTLQFHVVEVHQTELPW